MTVAVLAEKPSVARDIARVLGAQRSERGGLRGNGYVVTWAIGHLAALAEPHEVNPEWKRWRAGALPMIPERWPLVVIESTRDQFEIVAKILNDPSVERIVCATDAGREGELIFRYVYEAAGCRKPFDRLWISSLTPDAIRDGFARLRPGREFDGLADAARGRSRADWLVGMNLTRAYTLAGGDEVLSVGRVQTPTLAMLVERELEIRAFVPEHYCEVEADFASGGSTYTGTWFRELAADDVRPGEDAADRMRRARRLPPDGAEAEAIAARARTGRASVESVDGRLRSLPPPLLYDLTELQRHANRLFGFSAQKTLQIAQALYESHKLISYPRTDSRHLSTSVAATLPSVVAAIRAPYEADLAPGTGREPLGARFVDDRQVSDHHAIIPTAVRRANLRLSSDEERLFDLICRRLLQAWQPDHVYATSTVITRIANAAGTDEIVDRYRSTGTRVERAGWKALDPLTTRSRRGRGAGDDEPALPTALQPGLAVEVVEARSVERQTQPPRPLTEATLLTAMETAGRQLDDRELSDAMRDTGLGTPATRAAIIETLLARGYVERRDKNLIPTERGIQLIAVVHPDVKSPAMTGAWEAELGRMARGQGQLEPFLRRIESYVVDVVRRVRLQRESGALAPLRGRPGGAPTPAPARPAPRADSPARPTAVPSRSPAAAASSPTPKSGTRAKRPAKVSPHQPSLLDAPSAPPPAQRVAAPPPAPRAAEPVLEEPPAWLDEPPAWLDAPGDPGFDPGPIPDEPPLDARFDAPPPPVESGAPRTSENARSRAVRPVPRSLQREPAAARTRSATPPEQLGRLLRERFGFDAFRPHQEAVCRAATQGRDILLVMPTGAGKSLCYQLPGVARGGPTLVVSPLIALMDDQVQKLQQQGFRAERIHSGRPRGETRDALEDWRTGALDFLFIAPERLAVPGFLQKLAAQRPGLIAIDEAHCISQWGHDFRPEYRMLGERLPQLRPAPVIALTATATPRVQSDIAEQLGIEKGERHIHGFRRANLALELAELKPGARNGATLRLLQDPSARPAIVYAPTRRKAEELAAELAQRFPAAPYHAGIPAEARERTQLAFLEGRLEVVVATIAFGMGIDKANVRSVVHTALPGSIESYYQEVGRAGRDGHPSRAVLLHSFADTKTHEFFLERDYPPEAVLGRVYAALKPTPVTRAEIQRKLRMDPEELERALEKLWIHGGAIVDPDENTMRGTPAWAPGYRAQLELKREHLAQMVRYASSRDCRMLHLVRHFGDQEDSGAVCGLCDICDAASARALAYRAPSAAEQSALERVIAALRERNDQSSGRLHRELFGEALARRDFETLLDAAARAGLLYETSDTFDKDGQQISFTRITATHAGLAATSAVLRTLRIVDVPPDAPKSRGRKGDATRKRGGSRRRSADATPEHAAPADLVDALTRWRLAEARRRGIPAFRIMPNSTLHGLAAERPTTEAELLEVKGMGPTLVRKYGAELLALLRSS
jgi:DNA topoisomerase III